MSVGEGSREAVQDCHHRGSVARRPCHQVSHLQCVYECVISGACRWICFGNFLHKTAVVTCFSGLVLVPLLPNRMFGYVCLPLGVVGVGCAALYAVSWQFDPCCKYQVDREGRELTHIASHELHSSSPVVLVFRNDIYRKRLHNFLALAICAALGWRLYGLFYSQSQ